MPELIPALAARAKGGTFPCMTDAKTRAAVAALQHIRSGMTVGLGTGSTAKIFIDLLGAELKAGRLTDIRGIPTSERSDAQARSLGIPIVDFSVAEYCDVTVDGADEISPQLDLIKGLGGAMLREKVVAQNSKKMIVIADESKLVQTLGTKVSLPVEFVPFAATVVKRHLQALGSTPVLREDDGRPYVTDNGNRIYHCKFPPIEKPAELDRAIRSRAGVAETGLFVGIAAICLVAGDTETVVMQR